MNLSFIKDIDNELKRLHTLLEGDREGAQIKRKEEIENKRKYQVKTRFDLLLRELNKHEEFTSAFMSPFTDFTNLNIFDPSRTIPALLFQGYEYLFDDTIDICNNEERETFANTIEKNILELPCLNLSNFLRKGFKSYKDRLVDVTSKHDPSIVYLKKEQEDMIIDCLKKIFCIYTKGTILKHSHQESALLALPYVLNLLEDGHLRGSERYEKVLTYTHNFVNEETKDDFLAILHNWYQIKMKNIYRYEKILEASPYSKAKKMFVNLSYLFDEQFVEYMQNKLLNSLNEDFLSLQTLDLTNKEKYNKLHTLKKEIDSIINVKKFAN
jgi:hypothetical protein